MADAQTDPPVPGSLRSDIGGVNTQGSLDPLQDLRKWEETVRDHYVWQTLVERGSPRDLLVHFPNLNEQWGQEVRQTRKYSGDQDAMVKLLNFIIQSSNESWPRNLQAGLIDCGQTLIANLLTEKHDEIVRRPPMCVQSEIQGSAPSSYASISLASTSTTESSSIVILQHRNLYKQAIRNCQNHLRTNLDPEPLLRHFSYLQKDRINAANRTSGRGEAVDTFLEELMYSKEEHDWPDDFIQALRQNNQRNLADLVLGSYCDLRQKAFTDGKCAELKNFLSQQQPTAHEPCMETEAPGSHPGSAPGGP